MGYFTKVYQSFIICFRRYPAFLLVEVTFGRYRMDIVTVTDKAKSAISEILGAAVSIEYDMILNYPRLIDRLVNYQKIEDEALIKGLEQLGRDSLRHFGVTDSLMARMGYESAWEISAFPRLADILEILEKQLGKERAVRDMYRDAQRIAANNKAKVRGKEFFGKYVRIRESIPEDVVTADEIINTLDRIIRDEERHARVVEDSIATLKMLMKR